MRPFRLGLSHDFRAADGSISWGDIGLSALDGTGVEWSFLARDDGTLSADHVDGYDAVVFAAPAVDAATLSGPRPPLLLARFGVGVDAVDLEAATRAGTAVSITPDGARRAVATAALTLVLAVRQRLLPLDGLVRAGRWEERMDHLGLGLTGRTVGVVGLGGVARELLGLLAPFGTRNLASDPRAGRAGTGVPGVELVELDDLVAASDVVVVTAPLTAQTFHALDARRIALMKPGATLVNVARGPIVDLEALTAALLDGRIGGAGLDVFEVEPLPADHPLLALDTVVLSPHSLAWGEEMAMGNGSSSLRAVLAVAAGRPPEIVANPAVLDSALFHLRLAAHAGAR